MQLLTRYYQLQPVSAPTGEHVYQVGNGEHVQSELRTRPEAVLSSSTPQQSVVVELELARPGSQRVLPPRGPALQIPQVAAPPVAAIERARGRRLGRELIRQGSGEQLLRPDSLCNAGRGSRAQLEALAELMR